MYRLWVRKPEGKRPIGNSRRANGNFEIYLKIYRARVLTGLIWLRTEKSGELLGKQ